MLVMIEGAFEQMAHENFTLHHWHLVLRYLGYSGVLVTPGARKARTRTLVYGHTSMLSMATEAFEVVRRTYCQAPAWHQADVLLSDVKSAVRIVADLTVTIYASIVRRSAPWAMAGSAVVAELPMSGKQGPRLVTGARRKQ